MLVCSTSFLKNQTNFAQLLERVKQIYWMNVAVSASPFRHCYVPARGVGFQRVTQPRQSQTYFLSAPKIEIAPPRQSKGDGNCQQMLVAGDSQPAILGHSYTKFSDFFLESTVAPKIKQNLLIFLK